MSWNQVTIGIALYAVIALLVWRNNQGVRFESRRSQLIDYSTCSLFWTIVCFIFGAGLSRLIYHDGIEWFVQIAVWPYYLLAA